jgi:hypothetical protein
VRRKLTNSTELRKGQRKNNAHGFVKIKKVHKKQSHENNKIHSDKAQYHWIIGSIKAGAMNVRITSDLTCLYLLERLHIPDYIHEG